MQNSKVKTCFFKINTCYYYTAGFSKPCNRNGVHLQPYRVNLFRSSLQTSNRNFGNGMCCTPSTLLFMVLVPWHSSTTPVQNTMWKEFVLLSLKYHSLHQYAHIQATIQRDAGWQKLDLFIKRRISLYLSWSHILPWRIFFCQISAISFI